MTLDSMTWERWTRLSERERATLADISGLHPQLIGLEGRKVRIRISDDMTWLNGKPIRTFRVGKTTGWRPSHMAMRSVAQRGSSDLIDPKASSTILAVD
jgi:hypothetical protein